MKIIGLFLRKSGVTLNLLTQNGSHICGPMHQKLPGNTKKDMAIPYFDEAHFLFSAVLGNLFQEMA